MKKFNLLLATTAMLSTVLAMNTNATDVTSASLQTEVALVRPWNIQQTAPLKFGTVIAENDGEITITSNGSSTELTALENGSMGSILITGSNADIFASSASQILNNTEKSLDERTAEYNNFNQILNYMTWLSFTEAQPLTDTQDSSIVCGTILSDSFTQTASAGTNGIYVFVGGKLVLADDIEQKIATAGRKLDCVGSVTVTNITATANP